jgi:hypothetical protein
MLPDFNAAISRGVDKAIAASGSEVTVYLASGGTIVCKAVPQYMGIKLAKETGGERSTNRLVLEVAKAKYPTVTVNADKVRFPGEWVRKADDFVTWRVAGFEMDATAPGMWLLKMSA